MLAMFKRFASRYPTTVESAKAVGLMTTAFSANFFLMEYFNKDRPPEERQIFRDNFMDEEICREEMAKHRDQRNQ